MSTAKQPTSLATCAPRLPFDPMIEERFGIDKAAWKSLVEAIFPNATTINSVVLALSYCRARNLDVFKRCVHIVPIYNSATKGMVDTIWPGIGELRTTAARTGEWAGRDRTEFGPDVTKEFVSPADQQGKVTKTTVQFPEWAQVTMHRFCKGQRVQFVGPQVWWTETYAVQSKWDETPNSMWRTRPRGQLDKCAEAAALRAAFPEEVGSDYIPEEVKHQTIEGTVVKPSLTKVIRTQSLVGNLGVQTEQETLQVHSSEPSDAEKLAIIAAEKAESGMASDPRDA